MSSADVRDMLGLPTDNQPKARPPKKVKQEVRGRKPGGLEREILGLHGDRPAPPLSITELPRYKEKPKKHFRVRPWELTPFRNQARKDGLVLRHWRMKDDHNATTFPTTPADSNAASEEQDERIPKPPSDYLFAKYNIHVDRPVYNEEQYNSQLRSEDWTKEETDYLMDLAYEFDLRWLIIWDRYDYKPLQQGQDENAMALTLPPKQRSMEDLKARYYQVAAVAMTLVNPLTSMSESEFAIHEKMIKFDPSLETKRKQYAESMLSRSQDEIQEEETLLSELKRIVKNEEKFLQERRELYARLETAPSTTNATVNRSSESLSQLLKTLVEAEKNKRKRPLGEGSSTPANGPSGQNVGGQGDRTHRQSMDKRSSLSGVQGQRQLSARDAAKYGVTYPERLTAGVSFRHEKITKLSQAKSNAQSQKLSAALTEIGIPPRISMPTAKTTIEYERLISNIGLLLDARKISDRLENDIRLVRAQREPKEQQASDGEMKSPIDPVKRAASEEEAVMDEDTINTANADADDKPDDDAEAEAEAEADAEGDEEAEAEAEPEDAAEDEGEAEAESDSDEGSVAQNMEEGIQDEDPNEQEANLGDDNEAEAEAEAEDDEEDNGVESAEDDIQVAQPNSARTSRSASRRKRSASLMSAVSTRSTKSGKRQKR
ncbi:MAG: hypothetical protein Q9183_001527 [Haloplaca sp. 2 TL-2023]